MMRAVGALIREECEIVAEVEDGAAVLAAAAALLPNAVVLDISLPGISGILLLPRLRQLLPRATLVILTNHFEAAYRREAFLRGADAYVLKPHARTHLLPAIRHARVFAA